MPINPRRTFDRLFRPWIRTRGCTPTREQQIARRERDERENLPVPLPPTRRRLSELPPLYQPGRLLSLPAEIRLQIYEYVLGGPGVVHLFLGRRRVGHVRCISGDGDHLDPARRCIFCAYDRRPDAWAKHKHYDLRSSSANLALVLTCRAVYREAIDLLYSANVFDANHAQTLVIFARTIPSRRLAAVRAIRISWESLHPDEIDRAVDELPHWWELLWEVAATQMPGLQHIHVLLDCDSTEAHPDKEESLLAPLFRLRGLLSFELNRVKVPAPAVFEAKGLTVSALQDRIRDAVCVHP